MPNRHNARKVWLAMHKFAAGEFLTPSEWEALSQLTLINRSKGFGPGNCRWAETEAERKSNLAFYKKAGMH